MAEAIKGLEELKRKLATLPAKLEKKVLLASFRQGANVIRDAARQAAPSGETGQLKKKITTVSARGKPGTIRFQVRATARKVSLKYPEGYPYALAVEHGHGAPNTRSRLFGKTPKQEEFGNSQTPPHPFMRPAFIQSEGRALDKVADEIKQRFDRAVEESQ